MKLYKLYTHKLGEYYVVAQSADAAETYLKAEMEKAGFGFGSDRKVIRIDIITEQMTEFPAGKLNFASGKKLLIAQNNLEPTRP